MQRGLQPNVLFSLGLDIRQNTMETADLQAHLHIYLISETACLIMTSLVACLIQLSILVLVMHLKLGYYRFWQHQAVKFDLTADLTGTGNRLEEGIK